MDRDLGSWKEDACALKIVSPAYAGRDGELGAVLQYCYQSFLLDAVGEKELARGLLEIAKDEMRHLRLLGIAVARLGAQPVFSACPPYPVSFYCAANVCYSVRPAEMLHDDVCSEMRAIAAYRRMLCTLKNGDAAELIRSILEEEEGHLARLKAWRDGLC